jgi:predicted dehydrogenase
MAAAKRTRPALRWGVVGTSTISRQMTADIQAVEDAHVVAVSSRTLEGADRFADDFLIPGRYSDYRALHAAEDVDIVYIATPHVTHFEIASDAIANGKHVLCEKPLGLNEAEVQELGARARSAGVFLMEGMWMKFNPLHIKLLELIDAGTIGEVRSARASFGLPFPRDDSSRWKSGGSSLLDQGIYAVTLAEMLFGRPETITAAGTVGDHNVDLRGHYTMTYSADRHFQGASSQVEFLDLTATVSGTGGLIALDQGFWYTSRLTIHTAREGHIFTEVVDTGREGNGFVPMLRAVLDAVRRGDLEHPLHTTEIAARAYATMDEIRRQVTETSRPT